MMVEGISAGIFTTLEESALTASVFVLKAESFRTVKHFVLLTGTARYKTVDNDILTRSEDEN